ncbi:hypothetical protein TNCV_2426811 [Trichonephila clavipes]|nr:hypothetical protein TNCV_2426811 [Trichonephila clavipes]
MSSSSDVSCIGVPFLVLCGPIFISIVGLPDIVVVRYGLTEALFLRICNGCFKVWDLEGAILEVMLLGVVGSKSEGIDSADKAEKHRICGEWNSVIGLHSVEKCAAKAHLEQVSCPRQEVCECPNL